MKIRKSAKGFTSVEEFLLYCGEIIPDDKGCKMWPGGKAEGNYPGPYINEKRFRGNRVVLTAKLGRPIRPGFLACHECDEPLCVNEDHIYEGTPQDNMNDKVARGRCNSPRGERNGASLYPERRPRGEQHGRVKLTEKQVREIRKKRAQGVSVITLHTEYPVSKTTIQRIIDRTRWGHVT
jgi:hypothetical protein